MNLRIKAAGKTIALDLPETDDEIEIDLSDLQTNAAQISDFGPSVRTLYRHIASEGGEVSVIVPESIEELYGIGTIGLGRGLKTLERAGVIEIQKRSRVGGSGKVSEYRVKLLKESKSTAPPAHKKPKRSDILEDVRTECGEHAARLFNALVDMADVDGHIIGARPDDISEWVGDDMLQGSAMEALDESGFISIDSDVDGVSLTILDWSVVHW